MHPVIRVRFGTIDVPFVDVTVLRDIVAKWSDREIDPIENLVHHPFKKGRPLN
jgi:hypothetical protein